MASNVPFSEALMAMLAMLTVLTFVLIIYCFVPCYRAFQRQKKREEEWWERDPRWNNDRFEFSPNLPKDYLNDKKYSRMACNSRSSSVRSAATDKTDISPASSESSDYSPPTILATVEHLPKVPKNRKLSRYSDLNDEEEALIQSSKVLEARLSVVSEKNSKIKHEIVPKPKKEQISIKPAPNKTPINITVPPERPKVTPPKPKPAPAPLTEQKVAPTKPKTPAPAPTLEPKEVLPPARTKGAKKPTSTPTPTSSIPPKSSFDALVASSKKKSKPTSAKNQKKTPKIAKV